MEITTPEKRSCFPPLGFTLIFSFARNSVFPVGGLLLFYFLRELHVFGCCLSCYQYHKICKDKPMISSRKKLGGTQHQQGPRYTNSIRLFSKMENQKHFSSFFNIFKKLIDGTGTTTIAGNVYFLCMILFEEELHKLDNLSSQNNSSTNAHAPQGNLIGFS